MSRPPAHAREAARQAAQDTASADELLGAGERDDEPGVTSYRTSRRQRCPYPLGTLRAHVWLPVVRLRAPPGRRARVRLTHRPLARR